MEMVGKGGGAGLGRVGGGVAPAHWAVKDGQINHLHMYLVPIYSWPGAELNLAMHYNPHPYQVLQLQLQYQLFLIGFKILNFTLF